MHVYLGASVEGSSSGLSDLLSPNLIKWPPQWPGQATWDCCTSVLFYNITKNHTKLADRAAVRIKCSELAWCVGRSQGCLLVLENACAGRRNFPGNAAVCGITRSPKSAGLFLNTDIPLCLFLIFIYLLLLNGFFEMYLIFFSKQSTTWVNNAEPVVHILYP